MPSVLRRRLRRVRRGAGHTVAIAVVLLALVLGTASQVLPMAEQHPDRVAAWLSARAGRPISFDAVQTAWTRRGPLLQLENLRVGEGDAAFAVGDTEMLVSIYAGLLPGVPLSELRLRGLDLVLERADDGRWQVRGLPGQRQAGGDPFAALEGLGELQVIDGSLRVVAPASGIDTGLPHVDLRLRVDGDQVRAGLRAWPALRDTQDGEPPGPPIEAVLWLQRDGGDGRASISAPRVALAPWSPMLGASGIGVAEGQARMEVDARLQGHRITAVAVDADVASLVLRAVDGAIPDQALESVAMRARWERVGAGWRLEAPHLRLGWEGREYAYDGLLVGGGREPALDAGRVELAPLLQLAALSDRLAPAARRWLLDAAPRADLHDIAVATLDGRIRASARVEGLAFDPVGERPGVGGLSGLLSGDGDAFSLQVDPGGPVRFDWPAGFGVVHEVDLEGTIAGWRAGDGWAVGTGGLQVRGAGFGADLRGHLRWQGDGTRPLIDLAARLDDTALPVARGFLVRHRMPESLQDWLDGALVAGHLREGRAVIAGDLDDWPFTGGNGRFEARGRVDDGVLKFRPDWPAAEAVDAELEFVADGFSVEGSATLGGIGVQRVRAGIDHYSDGALAVSARGRGDVAALLDVLRDSPLYEMQPDVFESVSGAGPAAVDFGLRLPMGTGAVALDGQVALEGARLSAPGYGLELQQVRGQATYDGEGFHAGSLQVRHEDRPGVLALRAGRGHVLDAGNLFEGSLRADAAPGVLLGSVEQLQWLEPHLAGQSRWHANVHVARPGDGGRARPVLRLESDLVGTRLDLPAPLAKAAGVRLPLRVEASLPISDGEVLVTLGQRMALRARSSDAGTGVRVALGESRVASAPSRGLVVSGRTDVLDAVEWVGLAGGGGAGGDMPLGRIDVQAARLRLLGGEFPGTRLLVTPGSAGALRIQAEGASLQGELRVPATDGAAVAGRFTRAYWRRPAAAAGTRPAAAARGATAAGTGAPARAQATSAAQRGAGEPLDPSAIPPLVLVVDDLRIAGARLGQARLETRPTPAGLQVEQLQATGPGHRIDIDGSWIGRGEQARTRLSASLAAEDIGALLQGTPMGGRLSGGTGGVSLRADWAGTPADFNAADASGELVIDVSDGQLLELEPGAGRVLGLLSVAELPRRLSLDFRDFFSRGLAFNEAGGTIEYGGGIARTEGLRIEGPAADILIQGTANLRTERYDQTIEVMPSTGNLLTVAGALAGGPVGAAIGAAANAVLHKPMGQLGARTYHVTGPWDDPRVEVIRGDVPPGAAGEPPGTDPARDPRGPADPPVDADADADAEADADADRGAEAEAGGGTDADLTGEAGSESPSAQGG